MLEVSAIQVIKNAGSNFVIILMILQVSQKCDGCRPFEYSVTITGNSHPVIHMPSHKYP